MDEPDFFSKIGLRLGAAIGSPQFKEDYINEKVNKWASNIETLAEIAKSEPHAAYAAYLHGEQHKYNYFKRTLITRIQELAEQGMNKHAISKELECSRTTVYKVLEGVKINN